MRNTQNRTVQYWPVTNCCYHWGTFGCFIYTIFWPTLTLFSGRNAIFVSQSLHFAVTLAPQPFSPPSPFCLPQLRLLEAGFLRRVWSNVRFTMLQTWFSSSNMLQRSIFSPTSLYIHYQMYSDFLAASLI